MNKYEARALLFNRKLQGKPVEFEIPGVPELNGQLFIRELHARDTRLIDKMSRRPDGTKDTITSQAAVVWRGLLLAETKEPIFNELDIDAIAGNDKDDGGMGGDAPIDGFGTFVLKLLGDEISRLSGFDESAVEQAKQNFLATRENGSTSTSTENSEPQGQG
jgi:hypothetical protein